MTNDSFKPSLEGCTSPSESKALTILFFPAYAAYSMTKSCLKIPFLPFLHLIKILYPEMIDDVNMSKKVWKAKVKSTADKSLITLSSIVAK